MAGVTVFAILQTDHQSDIYRIAGDVELFPVLGASHGPAIAVVIASEYVNVGIGAEIDPETGSTKKERFIKLLYAFQIIDLIIDALGAADHELRFRCDAG